VAETALAGDSELFAGADAWWTVWDRIGDQSAFSRSTSCLLSQDGAYAEAERNLLARLATSTSSSFPAT
jgi:hypothetical protein